MSLFKHLPGVWEATIWEATIGNMQKAAERPQSGVKAQENTTVLVLNVQSAAERPTF